MKRLVSLLSLVFLLTGLVVLTSCAGDKLKDEYSKYHWTKTEISQETTVLPDDYKAHDELYLFATRKLIELEFDFDKVTLNDKPLAKEDTAFNLTSADNTALFLVGKFELNQDDDKDVLTLSCPSLQEEGQLAVGYKENQN